MSLAFLDVYQPLWCRFERLLSDRLGNVIGHGHH